MKTFAHARSVANTLRVIAAFMAINGISVLLPERWVDSVLVWCGLGHMPDVVLFDYLLRGAGFFLISFGALMWVVASDVVRYQPIVITIIAIFLVGVPVSYLTDFFVGLPSWWCVMDSTCCALAGGILLICCVWPSKKSPNTALEPTPTAP